MADVDESLSRPLERESDNASKERTRGQNRHKESPNEYGEGKERGRHARKDTNEGERFKGNKEERCGGELRADGEEKEITQPTPTPRPHRKNLVE